MKNKINHILLVDDSPSINFFNKKVIEKTGLTAHISIAKNGVEALTYFSNPTKSSLPPPEVIFLDINMPVMDGWEFLDHFSTLNNKNSMIILMLGTNLPPDDQKKIQKYCCIKGSSEKMLNKEFLHVLVDEHFND